MKQGPRIYNLFPPLLGPIRQWHRHLGRIADMGFTWIFLNPFHEPGFSGSLYAVKDYRRLNPLFRGDARRDDDALLAEFVEDAARHGLAVAMDLVPNHTAKDSVLVHDHPDWFAREPDGSLRSPGAVDPDDPAKVTVWDDLAEIDYADRPGRAQIVDYWQGVVGHYARLGFRGFRGDAAYKVPAAVWRGIIAAARAERRDAVFLAETLGCRPDEVTALHDAGFDYIFNSAKWWDFKAPWLIEQYEAFRHIAPSIAFPESHDTERLVADLARQGVNEPTTVEAVYRRNYLFAAAFSAGVMMPIGYEFGFRRKLDVVRTRPSDWEKPLFDLSPFIAEVNRMKSSAAPLNVEGPLKWSPPHDSEALALCRSANGQGSAVIVVNTDQRRAQNVAASRLVALGATPPAVEITPSHHGTRLMLRSMLRLQPAEARVFLSGNGIAETPATGFERPHATRTARREPETFDLTADLTSRAIVIQNVDPELDGGRYPIKREVGDTLEVRADIFKEGHDKIAAVLKWRQRGEKIWQEAPMSVENPGLDRWRGKAKLEHNARYEYTIEAWMDAYESWRAEVEKKREAGQEVTLELTEGRALVADALSRAAADDREGLTRVLAECDAARDDQDRALCLLSPRAQRLMARAPDRSASVLYDRTLEVVVDRVAARYAAWYEMFPRSQGTTPGKSATFDDCAKRLPEIRNMGFDVVYFVPVHPIGRSFRKGPNNTLNAGPDDPGSPYAIGGPEGGHDAVHPDLGGIEGFRRFVRAARAHGMEIALDFAIQCSPDHPWIKEHPEWFKFRPDGSIKYAENPPKKYQDIVNVNFYGPHRDALWRALRDVVLFWVREGVTIFRVDNPHTKPVPFWEWLIREVQAKHPETTFLSEAFTRPPMLKMLAKVGFSQSYTYFTWRNFKQELIDYFTELTQTEVKEYLRPNLFANTPDINPPYLQTGGRPAHQIRFVLAATLSSVYGIYSGFELCEATPIPGKEEYLDSEKYQYKVWDWNRPGHIKDTIARVNRIRRENPALQELDNLRFYPADDDNILFYGKMTPDKSNKIFVAVNLDPFEAHEAEIELPLAEMEIPDQETYEVEELLTGARHLWRGARQRVRLDPAGSPAAIFRVVPWRHVDFREPCF